MRKHCRRSKVVEIVVIFGDAQIALRQGARHTFSASQTLPGGQCNSVFYGPEDALY